MGSGDEAGEGGLHLSMGLHNPLSKLMNRYEENSEAILAYKETGAADKNGSENARGYLARPARQSVAAPE